MRGGGGGGSSEGGSGSGSGRPHRAGEENICASVQSALPYSLAPITSFAAAADGDGSNDDIRGVDCIGDDSVGINDVIGVDGNDGDGGGAIQLNVLRRPQVQVPFQSISSTHMYWKCLDTACSSYRQGNRRTTIDRKN